MQHEHHRVPVTALAFLQQDILLTGEGTYINAYNGECKLLISVLVFERHAVHGIVVCEDTVLVWSGPLTRSFHVDISREGDLTLTLGDVQSVGDWILDAAFVSTCEGPRVAGIVTAHNALWLVKIFSISTTGCANATKLERLLPGSNCILYSAHIQWLSSSTCLIASGTAFGDIIVWSATLTADGDTFSTQCQTHYTFSAHEGSVFGVHISSPLTLPASTTERRVLASCSDDRNIKLWDISDLSTGCAALAEIQRDTGVGSAPGDSSGLAPPCLARVMGHTSRIWHVRFVLSACGSELERLLSFGEDASVITWTIRRNGDPSHLPYAFEKEDVIGAHSGKHIWSVALSGAGSIATGGADGAIALRSGNQHTAPVRQIPWALLNHTGGGDNFRAYCFVDIDTFVATTDHGCIVVVNLTRESGLPSVTELSGPISGLRGYSVIASAGSVAFIAGTDGAVFSYAHRTEQFSKLIHVDGKTAGLFTCDNSTPGMALLITSVGKRSAELLLLDIDPESAALIVTKTLHLDLPLGWLVTTFACHVGADTTSRYVALGSRSGANAIYHIHEGTTSDAIDCTLLNETVHGKEAVTTLNWARQEPVAKPSNWIFSTGRDGTLAVHQVVVRDGQMKLHLAHQLSLPFGPNIEGLDLSRERGLTAWGFKSKHFIVYNISSQRESVSVECGGAHRNWAYQPMENGGTFVWTKASKLYRKTQSTSSYELLNHGSHGREIKSAAVSSASLERQILATGAEDTDIKLFRLEGGGFRCLQTIRRHNTGIQHLRWSDNGQYLFSSGGFEEFFIWKISSGVPYIDTGVTCESKHPRSGASDLRIMGFEVDVEAVSMSKSSSPCLRITMAYSDSTVKLWRYQGQTWELLVTADYLMACITHVAGLGESSSAFITAATDGHVAHWEHNTQHGQLRWTKRHKVHQNAIHATTSHTLADGSTLFITGGDDNAIGISRIASPEQETNTLLIPRAHAAAVTGLATVRVGECTYWLASAGIDQRVKLWEISIDAACAGVEGIAVRRLQDVFTAVADVSSLDVCRLEGGGLGVVVCGVGMDLWRLPSVGRMNRCDEIEV
ncbi:WD repeat-containing protein 6 [Vermiconidia calcicola]|uniref:WD repeat-containing protein 6 n=1 Tax=Vermiconidia calcicola TaxID=1690605 RepID=A0ACC3NM99_9PEZI|nr:WD repeat-containing protein 6 [Vermiconidia calcicola]